MNEKNVDKGRNSNIEFLRIVSILIIVVGHFLGQTKVFKEFSNSGNMFSIYVLEGIAVNLFLIIGTWFMVDREFKAKRVVKMYSEVFLYTSIITTIMVILRINVPLKQIIQGYFPLLGRPLWFASAYITLLLLTPYLKKVLCIGEKKLFKLVLLLFIFISVVSTLPEAQNVYLCNSLWFIFMYLLIGYYKKYRYKKDNANKKYIYLLVGVGTCLLVITLNTLFKNNETLTMLISRFTDIKSIPSLVSSLCIFLFFENMKTRNNKTINFIAKSTFSVYIIHQVPAFINYMWYNIFRCDQIENAETINYLYIIGIVLSIYIFASILDNLRQKFIEPIWENSKIFSKICEKIDNFYEKDNLEDINNIKDTKFVIK